MNSQTQAALYNLCEAILDHYILGNNSTARAMLNNIASSRRLLAGAYLTKLGKDRDCMEDVQRLIMSVTQ